MLALAVVVTATSLAVLWLWVGSLLRVHPVAADYSLHVLALGDNTITLERRGNATLTGTYGLEWADGHAVLGAVVRASSHEVVRRICMIRGTRPRRGMTLGLRNNVYWSDPAQLGLHFRDVSIRGDIGLLPAWYVPARRRTWAILVHGLGGSRRDALQVMPTVHRLELPILDISYRNDGTAASTVDGRTHLGASEWRDLAAAIRYARGHGAEKVIVFAYSLGGAMVQELLGRSPQASAVIALILDSPVLDWKRTIAAEGDRRHVPAFITDLAAWIAVERTGLRLSDVSIARFSKLLAVPTLLIQGSADIVVPVSASDRFAELNPRFVTYYRSPRVGHAGAWNTDPAGYQRRLIRFFERVGISSAATSTSDSPTAACMRRPVDPIERIVRHHRSGRTRPA